MNRLKKILLVSMSFVLILSACGGYEKGTDDYKKEENIATAESAEKTAKDYNRELEDKITAIQKLIDENYLDYKENNTELEDAYQNAVKGYVASLGDKYSEYFPPEKASQYKESIDGSFVGIGVYAGFDNEEKRVVITRVMDNGPAYEAGIQMDDIVMSIDGKDVYGVSLDDVVAMMKGVEGTKVKLSVKRGEEELTFDLIRRKIETPTIYGELLDGELGYIYIAAFDTVTVKQFSQMIDELTEAGMKGLIIDIRNNGGGSLYSVTELSDRLLDKDKLVLYTIDSKGKREDSITTKEDKIDVPVAVLVNQNTASAAEVFAGCLRLHMNAVLVGSTTFGKGIMQQIYPLGDGSSLKLTVAKWYLADDTNIQDIGLEPDIAVEQPADSTVDEVFEKAIEYLRSLY